MRSKRYETQKISWENIENSLQLKGDTRLQIQHLEWEWGTWGVDDHWTFHYKFWNTKDTKHNTKCCRGEKILSYTTYKNEN